MRALLDTNIIIHRENTTAVSNYSVGHLYRWLDNLGIEKAIHPFSVQEIEKFDDDKIQALLKVKLESYTLLNSHQTLGEEFLEKLNAFPCKNQNDHIDNHLLFEVYTGRADILITEDRKLIQKAQAAGIGPRVYTINRFISRASSKHPGQIEYGVLGVQPKFFSDIKLESSFFDSFRRDYPNFDYWFNSKCNEKAYVAENENGDVFGFLYLKTENKQEVYSDISPVFSPKRRLKVGTFKVESTGFRLGERFIKIIFDNALRHHVDEVYVTLFSEKEDIVPLSELLLRWGFVHYGVKNSIAGEEVVMIKRFGVYDAKRSVRENFPNLLKSATKYILPILPQYHTDLCPDSILKTESPNDFIENKACRYALQKIYISFSFERNIYPGDFLLIYRNGPEGTSKKYSSVLTTVGVVNGVYHSFENKQEYQASCQNRSVFTDEELDSFWSTKKNKILVIEFIFIKQLTTKIQLGFLWDNGIVERGKGPRPFTSISDSDFFKIVSESKTELSLLI